MPMFVIGREPERFPQVREGVSTSADRDGPEVHVGGDSTAVEIDRDSKPDVSRTGGSQLGVSTRIEEVLVVGEQ